MKHYILLALFFTSSFSVAQTLSLNECIEMAIANSEDLKISQSEVFIAEKQLEATNTGYLPSLTASANGSYTAGELQSGGLEPRDYSYGAALILRQTIYGGNSVSAQSKADKIELNISDLVVQRTEQEVIYSAKIAYYSLVATLQQLEIARHYINIVQELQNVVKIRYEEGYISLSDVLMVETRLNEAELQLLTARKLWRTALREINTTVGNITEIEYTPVDTIASPRVMPQLENLDYALSNRADYLASELTIGLQGQNVKVARSNFNPQLYFTVEGRYGTPLNNTILTGMDCYGVVQLNFSATIFEFGKRRKTVAAAKELQNIARHTTANLQQTIVTTLGNAEASLEENFNKCQLTKKNLEVASENLALSTFRYEEGGIPILDVLSAQLSWQSAYTSSISALFDYAAAEATYRFTIGE